MADGAVTSLAEQLAPQKQRIMGHMNEDHGDSLLVYAKHYAKLESATKAVLTDMCTEGLTLDVSFPEGRKDSGVFVQYSRPPAAVQDVRKVVEDMHHEAYDALGYAYKLRSGFYKMALRMAFQHVSKTKKLAMGFAAVSAGALVVLTIRLKRNAQRSIEQ